MSGLTIPHNRPLVTAADRDAVARVLESGWLAQGAEVARLEANCVRVQGGGAACAVSSGTAALFLALKALDAGPDVTVAVPSYSCSALLNAVLMAGARPLIADVQPDNFCLDPAGLRRVGQGAHIAIAVHVFGAPADVAAFNGSGMAVIEDCCQAVGGRVGSVPLGTAGAAAVFSFYATKIITGGQGGMVLSDARVIERVRDYREFDGREDYVPRFNLQMTDIQAALVNSQLARLEEIRARRADIAKRYLAALPQGLSTQTGLTAPGRMVHRFVIVAPDQGTRERLRAHLREAGIGCSVPIERFEMLHRYLKLDPAGFPVCERLADTTLSLPVHLCLSDAEVDFISHTLSGFRP